MNNIYTTTHSISSYVIKQPIYKWECKINDFISFELENSPNLFHRLMQRLILGFEWKKIN